MISGHPILYVVGCLYSFDSIEGSSWCVVSHMRGCHGMTCSPRNGLCRTFCRISCGSMRRNCRFTRLAHADLATRPRPCCLDCLPRSVVLWILLAPERQYVFRAIRRPNCKQTMPMEV